MSDTGFLADDEVFVDGMIWQVSPADDGLACEAEPCDEAAAVEVSAAARTAFDTHHYWACFCEPHLEAWKAAKDAPESAPAGVAP